MKLGVSVVIDPRQRRALGRSASFFESVFLSLLLVRVHIVASAELIVSSMFKMADDTICARVREFSRE